jgi:hypothetical protein
MFGLNSGRRISLTSDIIVVLPLICSSEIVITPSLGLQTLVCENGFSHMKWKLKSDLQEALRDASCLPQSTRFNLSEVH